MHAHNPTRHTFGATQRCFSRSSAPIERRREPVCVKTSPPRCRMCFIEEKYTFQDRTDMSCDFQPPFIEGEGEQYLRVIFSAVRMCSMLQFQG